MGSLRQDRTVASCQLQLQQDTVERETVPVAASAGHLLKMRATAILLLICSVLAQDGSNFGRGGRRKVLRRRPSAFENVPAVPEQRPSSRGRGFARARAAAPVASQPAQAPAPALPPPPPVFTPEPTGELVTG